MSEQILFKHVDIFVSKKLQFNNYVVLAWKWTLYEVRNVE